MASRFDKRLSQYYMDRILGFAYNRTGDRSKAEDLAQDIIVEILTGLTRASEIRDFDAWVWSVARYTYCHWLEKQSGRYEVRLTGIEAFADEVDSHLLSEEEINALRREIGFLSNSQRRTIIMYYYEGRSCDEIARTLKIPVGTVKWRLFDARRDLKKGMTKMTDYGQMTPRGQRSFNPGSLQVGINGRTGSDGSPVSLVKRAIPQNILLAAYDQPVTIVDIARELGIPAPYIEEEVQILLDGELLVKIDDERVRTNFIITKFDTALAMLNEVLERAPEYSEAVFAALNDLKNDILSIGFYGADLPWSRLMWVMVPFLVIESLELFASEKSLSGSMLPVRPHGGRWIAIGSEQPGSRVNDLEPAMLAAIETVGQYSGPRMSGRLWWFGTHWSGLDNRLFDDIKDQDIELCRLIATSALQTNSLTDDQKERLSVGIERGYIEKSGDRIRLLFPFFLHDQVGSLAEILKRGCSGVERIMVALYRVLRGRLSCQVPEHLKGEMEVNLFAYTGLLAPATLAKGIEKGLLSQPEERGRGYLSFFMHD